MNKNRSDRPRMRDIASQAGVSLGTVSRVLNGKTDVAPSLAKRVMKAVKESGYEPRASLRAPQPHQDRLGPIGILMDDIAYSSRTTTPFQANLIHGIEQRSRELGGHMVLSNCQEDAKTGSLPSMIQEGIVQSAIIRVNRSIPDSWINRIAEQIPTVLLMHRDHKHTIPSIYCDNHGSITQIFNHLSRLNHRRIGFYSEDEGKNTNPIHIERQFYFERLLSDFGFSTDPELVQVPQKRRGENYKDLIDRTCKKFLQMGKDRPTAIVCAADTYALHLQTALRQQGLSLPRDMSVIGFMNTEDCNLASPPLTSISLNEEELGRTAVDLLHRRMQNPNAIVRHILVATDLIIRESCAPPNSQT
ncbi:MAG: LacI family DNA-binding transcriptional regulator [Puniceicoccales bacterium]